MKKLYFRNVKRSFIIFSSIILVFLILLLVSYVIEYRNFIDKMSLSLSSDVNTYQATFTDEVTGIASDVQVIKQLLTHNDVLVTDGTNTSFISPVIKTTVQNSMLAITQSINYFDQMRIIDTQGMEIVRINNNNGSAYIVEDSELQDKSDRYYFINSIGLGNNCIYISEMDLNVENDVIEIVDGQYKPMLRFATPLYSSTNQVLGILVVNYLVNDIFNGLKDLKQNESSELDIINEDGYYLYSDNDVVEFGFMFDDKIDETIDKYNDFDVLGNTNTSIQQFVDKGYIYTTFAMDETLFSASISEIIGSNITLVSESGTFIIYSQLNYRSISEYQQRLNIYIIIASISVLIAYVITRLFDEIDYGKKERMKALQYLAEHDYLTNLPNRAHIMTLLTERISKQKMMSIMFLDLDGFKEVNDQHGHIIGDQVLIESSERIINNVREPDIVARVGGDEFIVLFENLSNRTTLSEIAKRILDAFKEPFDMNEHTLRIGLSIGIALYEKGQSLDDLINHADQAMYDIKEKNKNDYEFFN